MQSVSVPRTTRSSISRSRSWARNRKPARSVAVTDVVRPVPSKDGEESVEGVDRRSAFALELELVEADGRLFVRQPAHLDERDASGPRRNPDVEVHRLLRPAVRGLENALEMDRLTGPCVDVGRVPTRVPAGKREGRSACTRERSPRPSRSSGRRRDHRTPGGCVKADNDCRMACRVRARQSVEDQPADDRYDDADEERENDELDNHAADCRVRTRPAYRLATPFSTTTRSVRPNKPQIADSGLW